MTQASQTRTWERPCFSRCQKTWPWLTQACYWESTRCGASILPCTQGLWPLKLSGVIITAVRRRQRQYHWYAVGWHCLLSASQNEKNTPDSRARKEGKKERTLSSQVSKMTDEGYRVKTVAQGQQCERGLWVNYWAGQTWSCHRPNSVL